MTTCPVGFNLRGETDTSDLCVNSPLFWIDAYGDTCQDYENFDYCVVENGVGKPSENWDVSQLGEFSDIGDPDKHCCYCGGGSKFTFSEKNLICTCPENSTLVNNQCIPTDSSKVIKRTGDQKVEICTSQPFTDRLNLGFDCRDYAVNNICDPARPDRKGLNWDDRVFDESVLSSCCECGGGLKSEIVSPVYRAVDICPENSFYDSSEDSCVCTIAGQTVGEGGCQCPPGQIVEGESCVCTIAGQTVGEGGCQCPPGQIVEGESCIQDSKKKRNLPMVFLWIIIIILFSYLARKLMKQEMFK